MYGLTPEEQEEARQKECAPDGAAQDSHDVRHTAARSMLLIVIALIVMIALGALIIWGANVWLGQ